LNDVGQRCWIEAKKERASRFFFCGRVLSVPPGAVKVRVRDFRGEGMRGVEQRKGGLGRLRCLLCRCLLAGHLLCCMQSRQPSPAGAAGAAASAVAATLRCTRAAALRLRGAGPESGQPGGARRKGAAPGKAPAAAIEKIFEQRERLGLRRSGRPARCLSHASSHHACESAIRHRRCRD